MPGQKYAITCLVVQGGRYYMGRNWTADIGKACLYATRRQAESALNGTARKSAGVSVRCVIQNKLFDYYDGTKFVYDLSEAKLYTFRQAEAILGRLQRRNKT